MLDESSLTHLIFEWMKRKPLFSTLTQFRNSLRLAIIQVPTSKNKNIHIVALNWYLISEITYQIEFLNLQTYCTLY